MTNHKEATRRWCAGEEPTLAWTFPRTFGAVRPSPDRLTRPTMSPLCRVRMARGCAVGQDNFNDYVRHSSAASLRVWLGIAGPEGRVWTLGL